jgi:hypothetical protein
MDLNRKRQQKRWSVIVITIDSEKIRMAERLTKSEAKKTARGIRPARNVAAAFVRYEPLR